MGGQGQSARLSVSEAIGAHTLGQASALGYDHRLGSLEVDKKADVIVLEKNLFDVDMYDISEATVQFTMMNGNVTNRDRIQL